MRPSAEQREIDRVHMARCLELAARYRGRTALVKPTAVVINTSRGPVVDEPALIRALTERRLSGAALDVFEHEPLPLDSPLRTMENVMLAAHNSNSSPAAWERVHTSTIQNLLDVLEGKS